MDTIAYIPVRGGSKSIPHKNIELIAGKPLVHWTMEAALACPHINRLYVASEDPTIRGVANQIVDDRLEVIDRDPLTATDDATTESALLSFARTHDFNTVVLIQATSPLLTATDLTLALEKFSSSTADSMLSVVREHRFIWRRDNDETVTPANYDPLSRPRRQDWNGELIENGAFYITTRKSLEHSQCRISGKTTYYEMLSSRALELDDPHDWPVIEMLLKNSKDRDLLTKKCRQIKLIVTDVDGVLTDSGVYVGPQGEVCKKFSTRDGMGFALLRKAGIKAAIMTAENSPIVSQRAAKLKIQHVFMGINNKGAALQQFLISEGLPPNTVAFIGDDLNDIPALKLAGLAVCPANASNDVKRVAHYICQKPGGEGCVRELIDLILDNN